MHVLTQTLRIWLIEPSSSTDLEKLTPWFIMKVVLVWSIITVKKTCHEKALHVLQPLSILSFSCLL